MAPRAALPLYEARLSRMTMSPRPGRGEQLFDIGGEQCPVDGTVEHVRGLDAIAAQGGDKRHRHPVTVWHRGGKPPAFRPPATQRRPIGLHPCLVEKDQALRIDPALMRLPAPPLAG